MELESNEQQKNVIVSEEDDIIHTSIDEPLFESISRLVRSHDLRNLIIRRT